MLKPFFLLLLVIFTIGSAHGMGTFSPDISVESESEFVKPEFETAAKGHFQPERIVKSADHIYYGISRERGFLVSTNQGRHWEPRNEGLPTKPVWPFKLPQVRPLTSIGVDPLDPRRVAVSTSQELYYSENAGISWRKIPLNRSFPSQAYLTAVALSPFNADTFLVGTAFSGLYETTNLGKNWTNLTPFLKFLYQGAGFCEAISAVSYLLPNPEQLIFSCGYGKGLYLFNKTSKMSTVIHPKPSVEDHIFQIGLYQKTPTALRPAEWILELAGPQRVLRFNWDTLQQIDESPTIVSDDPGRLARQTKAANKYGLYLRYDLLQGSKLDERFRFVKRNGLNAVVIDFKDDSGWITYNTGLELPQQIGAVRPRIKINDFLKKARQEGIYIIGRIVVFKDARLYRYQNNKYAIWDRKTAQPWGHLIKEVAGNQEQWVQREFWVDPYHPEVWDYNIAIAEELQRLGVDEIQFDYIRFPTDGDLSSVHYRYQRPGMQKIDALESFLSKARSRISVPISTDLYGFNCWFAMDSWNGQNMTVFSQYVDVICPMFYPSHFPSSFLKTYSYLERAKQIYDEGTSRAQWIGENKTLIRPYVQAFLLGGERNMNSNSYSKYLFNQIEGALSGGASGFLLWNFSNHYYMLTKPVTAYLPLPEAERHEFPASPQSFSVEEEVLRDYPLGENADVND